MIAPCLGRSHLSNPSVSCVLAGTSIPGEVRPFSCHRSRPSERFRQRRPVWIWIARSVPAPLPTRITHHRPITAAVTASTALVGRSPVAVAPPDASTARCIGGSSWCRQVTANFHKLQWVNSKRAPKSLLPPHRGCACRLPHPARRDEDPDPKGGPNPTGQRGPATGPCAKSVHVAATRRATYFGANRIISGSKPTFPGSISSRP